MGKQRLSLFIIQGLYRDYTTPQKFKGYLLYYEVKEIRALGGLGVYGLGGLGVQDLGVWGF